VEGGSRGGSGEAGSWSVTEHFFLVFLSDFLRSSTYHCITSLYILILVTNILRKQTRCTTLSKTQNRLRALLNETVNMQVGM
jgi:hypothetical protein